MKPILFNTEMVQAILDGRKTMTRRVIKENNKMEQITLDRLCGICGFFDQETMNYGCTHKECGETGEDINGQEHGRCFSWSCPFGQEWGYESDCESSFDGDTYMNIPIPSYQVGDVLWVRETTWQVDCDCQPPWTCDRHFGYKADEYDFNGVRCYVKTIPSIHMPKEHARIFLRVTNVKVERLQDITFVDTTKEGLPFDVKIDIQDIEHNAKLKNAVFDTENEMFKWWKTLWNSTAKEGYKWEDSPYVFVYEFERVEKPKDNA